MNNLVEFIKIHHRKLLMLFIALALPGIYAFVYFTGGIKYVYSHTMYIPILIAGIVFGMKYGLLVGLIGGILLGPLMPIEFDPLERQLFLNWFYRLIIFLSIGGLSGYYADRLRKVNKINEKLFAYHIETDVPNINYLLSLDDYYISGKCLLATILINNKHNIYEVLGTETYNKVLNALYQSIKTNIEKKTVVIQADTEKLWLILPSENGVDDSKLISETLSHDLEIDKIKIYVDYSIGVTEISSFKECKSLSAFRDSDKLAGHAKKNNLPYVLFDKAMIKEKFNFNLLGLFPSALKTHETYLVYQPVINSITKEIVGVEALIRWNNELHGLIMPNDFIPLVESTQLIHPMTSWVIREVMRKQKMFRENNLFFLSSINLSVKNLHDPNFYNHVMRIVKEEEADPNYIVFEVTETVLLKEAEQSKQTITQLKEAGFKIAIDDFGKGYSSLTYLCQFSIDYLKIDRYFMSNIADNNSVFEIVSSTVKLAHQLNLMVVAEGIETEETYEIIKKLGCDYTQGYYIARPIDDTKIIAWCLNHNKKLNKQ